MPYYGVEKGDIGYIALNTYSESTADEVKKAVTDLTANPDVKALVLDLRGNVGGLVESAVKVVGNFVPKGTEVCAPKAKGFSTKKSTKQPRHR